MGARLLAIPANSLPARILRRPDLPTRDAHTDIDLAAALDLPVAHRFHSSLEQGAEGIARQGRPPFFLAKSLIALGQLGALGPVEVATGQLGNDLAECGWS